MDEVIDMNQFVKKIDEFSCTRTEKFFKTTLFQSEALMVGLNCLEHGQVQEPHVHENQDKFYYIKEGRGIFWLGDDRVSAVTGEIIWAPAGLLHGVENQGDGRLTLLVGIAPAP